MNTQTLLIHIVTIDSARGPIRRTVIAEVGDVLVLAELDGAEQAKIGEITKYSIGFKRSDVLSVDGVDNSVSLKHNVQYEQA